MSQTSEASISPLLENCLLPLSNEEYEQLSKNLTSGWDDCLNWAQCAPSGPSRSFQHDAFPLGGSPREATHELSGTSTIDALPGCEQLQSIFVWDGPQGQPSEGGFSLDEGFYCNYLNWQSWPPIEEASVSAASWAEILPSYFPSPPPKAEPTNDAHNPTATSLPPVSRTNNPNVISTQFIFQPVITQREALDLQSRYFLLANAPLPTRIPTPAPTPILSASTPISFHDYAPHQQPPALIPRLRTPSVPVIAPSAPTFSASPSKNVNLPHRPTASRSQSKPTASQETEAYNALLALEQNRARFDVQKNLFELDDNIPKEKRCQWGLPAGEHPHTTPTDHRGAKEHLRKVHGLKLESSEKLACGLPGCVDSCDWGSIGRHLEREKHFHSARVHCRLCGAGNQVRGGTVRGRDHIRTACSWTRPEITLEKLRERLIESGVFKGDLTLSEMSTSHSIASSSARGNKRRKLSED